MTAPAPLRRTFVGPQGIRAGWRLLLFVVLAQGLIGLPLQWFVVRVLRLGDGGEWTAPGFILAETLGGLGIIPTFAAAWLMSRMERRPFGAYGLPSRGALGRQFWAGWGWGLGGVAVLAALIAALGGLRVAGWALSGAALARAALLWAIAMALIGLAEEFAFRGYPQFTLASGVGFLAGGRAALAPVRRAALLPQADGKPGGLRERRADRSVSVPDVAAHGQPVVRRRIPRGVRLRRARGRRRAQHGQRRPGRRRPLAGHDVHRAGLADGRAARDRGEPAHLPRDR